MFCLSPVLSEDQSWDLPRHNPLHRTDPQKYLYEIRSQSVAIVGEERRFQSIAHAEMKRSTRSTVTSSSCARDALEGDELLPRRRWRAPQPKRSTS